MCLEQARVIRAMRLQQRVDLREHVFGLRGDVAVRIIGNNPHCIDETVIFDRLGQDGAWLGADNSAHGMLLVRNDMRGDDRVTVNNRLPVVSACRLALLDLAVELMLRAHLLGVEHMVGGGAITLPHLRGAASQVERVLVVRGAGLGVAGGKGKTAKGGKKVRAHAVGNRRNRVKLNWGQGRQSATCSMILPICVLPSISRWASVTSSSGKTRSMTGAILPRSSSGQSFCFRDAAMAAFSAELRGRMVEPVMVRRLVITVIKSSSALEPCMKATCTSRPRGARQRMFF